jgi:hypothetical protein
MKLLGEDLAQGAIVAPDLPEAPGEHRDVEWGSEPGPDLSHLGQRLLHLSDARLALPRFDPRPSLENPA